MNILFKKVFRFDLDEFRVNSIELLNNGNDFENYLDELLTDVFSSSRSRKYLFPPEPTAIKSSLNEIIKGESETSTKHIANRLLKIEGTVQKRIEHLETEVQKGILIQSLIEHDGVKCFIIAKAENQDFINENDNRKAKGLPTKKKIFKSFCAFFNPNDEPIHAMVTDSSSKIAPYWWQRFLELIEEHTDEHNTREAFDALDRKIFNKFQKDCPEDYMTLRNATVNYFRVNEEFIMEDYLDKIIRNYEPENIDLNVKQIEINIGKLPESQNFDNRFKIVKGLLRKKILKRLFLTPQLDLEIKDDIKLITDVRSILVKGVKHIQIRTDKGYDYFPKVNEG